MTCDNCGAAGSAIAAEAAADGIMDPQCCDIAPRAVPGILDGWLYPLNITLKNGEKRSGRYPLAIALETQRFALARPECASAVIDFEARS